MPFDLPDATLNAEMAAKTDAALQDYLIDIKQHPAAEVQAALSELQKRGKYYSPLQLEYLHAVIKAKFLDEDPNTPTYYSKGAVLWSSMVYSVLFSAVLLSMNLPGKREKVEVVGFGLLYLGSLIVLESFNAVPVMMLLALNILGGILLQTVLWNRYIGKDVYYKKRSVFIPFLVGLVLLLICIALNFNDIKTGFTEGYNRRF